jgi:hypothetical protein
VRRGELIQMRLDLVIELGVATAGRQDRQEPRGQHVK